MSKYDVVIVGSGLGGLACGVILAKAGKRVCVIEKNEQIGGSLQTFKRDGVTFDTGVHYIGGLDKGQNLYRYFNYLGIMDRLELQRMDTQGFDVVLFGDDEEEYPYGMGYENFTRILCEKFPQEKNVIETYCTDLKNICAGFPLYNLQSANYVETGIFTKSAKEYIHNLTANPKLRNVLAGTGLLYAGVPDKTPLYVHALVINSYIESAWRCSRGSDQIAKLLAREIVARDGKILRKHKVTKLEMKDELIEAAVLADGTAVYGDCFISNIHPIQTFQLLGNQGIRAAYRNRIANLENSISGFTVYAVMKPGTIPYLNRNYYYFEDEDVWDAVNYDESKWPTTYAMFEVVPHKQHEYCEAYTIIAYMKFEEVAKWADTTNTTLEESERGTEYQEFKRRKAEALLKVVEKKFPGFRDKIQTYYTSTPLSIRDYIGTDNGSMYGIIKDYNDPLRTFLSPKTKIANLFLTGQNINLHGVLGVTVSAVITSGFILGKESLMAKIYEHETTA